MKNLSKKIISMLLALMMLVSVLPAGTLTAQAAGGVETAIEKIAKVYYTGSFFSNTKGSCGPGQTNFGAGNYCTYCQLYVMDRDACRVCGNGDSCWAFSHYVFYKVFGSNADANPSRWVSPGQLNSVAKIGDLINCNNCHYLIYMGKSGNGGFLAYESNVDTENKVVYKNYHSVNAWGGYTVYHANNYDKINNTSYSVNASAASSISNEDAKIGFSISNKGTTNTYGYFLSTNKNNVSTGNCYKHYVVNKGTSVNNAAWSIQKYGGALKPNTTYYYKVWADIGGNHIASGISSFRTTNNKPTAAKLTVESNSKDIGIGDQPTVNWKKSDYVSTYTAVLYDSKGNIVQTKDKISKNATSYTFNPINKAGTYYAYINAKNSVGEVRSTPVGVITVHPDVTVTYKDAAPSSFVDFTGDPATEADVIDTYSVHYGHDAPIPATPYHKGYKFSSWDKTNKKITEDNTVITAQYSINRYTVTFVSETGVKLKEETVNYYSSPTAPDYAPEKPGYVFVAWDKDFEHVDRNMKVTAVIDWYNKNYSVYTTVTDAVRDETDKGYQINFTVYNNAESTTTGRIVIALKTEDGKLLTSTESAAFSIKPDKTRSFEEFVKYDNPASKVYAYVVDDYKTMTPISQEASRDIDNGLEWTEWSPEKPAEGTYTDLNQREEYSYRTRETTTSYATSLSGYTQNGYTKVKASSGTIEYASFPGGYNRSDSYYKKYANKSLKSNSNTSTQITEVSNSTIGYLYWHWTYPLSGSHSEGNRVISDTYNEWISGCGNATVWESFMNGSKLSWNSSASAYKATGHSTYSYWWFSWTYNNSTPLEVKRQTWTTYNKLYNYYKISDYCDWTPNSPSNSYGTVNTRTTYSYKPVNPIPEDTSGVTRTISGNLGTACANKQATLYIYKVDEASDYSNEYIGQTTIAADGSYAFTFKLREEPSVKTGDYTVVLGLEGANSMIYLDPIIAPKPTHTVIFKDWEGNQIGEAQTVVEGEDAILPEAPAREGYHFTHWNNSNLNVVSDMEITAEYEINKYTVVFVDWEARSVQIKEFEHGAELVAPDFENDDPGVNVVWDKIADGTTTVTQNMVVCTEYTDKVYNVEFKDFDGDTISEQTVTYGYAADIPELDEDGKIFLGWEDEDTREIVDEFVVTSKINVCPRYVYEDTCEMPVADVETGEYSTTQIVSLSCPTPDAEIYYTLDGSDPKGENAVRYTTPITVRDCATLRCYAVALGMNDSGERQYLYVVNPEKTVSDYMKQEDLPNYVINNPLQYNITEATGYIFKDTVSVSKTSDYENYTNNNWTLDTTGYSEWTDWQDDEIVTDESLLYHDIETRDYDYQETVPSNKFERWTYLDNGNPVYSNVEVEGFSGEWERIEVPQTVTAKINGNYNNSFTYAVTGYEGSWFKPKTGNTGTIEVTKTKTQYRSRYLNANLYKWTETPVLELSPTETREYQTIDLYRYEFLKHFIVNVYIGGESEEAETGIAHSFIVENGSKISADAIDEPYGMNFSKLYKDAAHTQEWNLDTDTVTQNETLYATFTNKSFNVTFAYADGTEIETQSVEYMSAANAPSTIELPDGYLFLGWDTDAYNCVTKDMTVHARYVAEGEYSTVSFDVNEISVLAGTTATIDAQTSVPGKTVEWTSSNEDVAIVEDGTVKGISDGTATIRATVSETGEYDECVVTVYRNVSTQVSLITNSSLKFDTNGYIRGVRADGATVKDVLGEFANKSENLLFKDIADKELTDDSKIGTGTTVSLVSKTNVIDKATMIVTGDVTGDGVVNNRDVAMLNMYLVDKINPAEYQILAMDVNGDGTINNRDAAAIARYIVGKATL